MTRKRIKVDYLARVEGEGALDVILREGRVEEVRLSIFEPPRFFEAFLRDRAFTEAPDITARICGICPVAYQMSAVHAMEAALGVTVDGPLRELRRLLYCGEWIESHALHVYMLHAPDFLGYAGAVEMAADHGDAVRRGLELKKAGNEIVRLLAGREVHPINVRVGGFYKAPRRTDLRTLEEPLKRARDAALETIRWVSGFDFPAADRAYLFVSLSHPDGITVSTRAGCLHRRSRIPAADYASAFPDQHSPFPCTPGPPGRRAPPPPIFWSEVAPYGLNHDGLTRGAAGCCGGGALTRLRNRFQSIRRAGSMILYACE